VSAWPSKSAIVVYRALLRIGWRDLRQRGSHRILSRVGWPNYTFPFHDREEIGPVMRAKIAKKTA
jgi:predicted RNA binding protein YcfA (HicA-like mRNA interferase family)